MATRSLHQKLQNNKLFHRQLEQACHLQNQGEIGQAEQQLLDIQRRWPREPQSLQLLGLIRHSQERFHEAYDMITSAINQLPNVAQWYCNRSVVLADMERHEEAREDLESALRLDDTLPDAINNMGMTMIALKRHKEALDFALRYAELRPERAQTWFNLGIAWQENGDHAQAVECYHKCLDIDSRHAGCMVNLSNAYRECNDYAQSQLWLTRAEEADPNSPDVFNSRGAILKDTGRPNASIPCYERAIQLARSTLKKQQYAYNLSVSMLLTGQYPHAWHLYNHRFAVVKMPKVFAESRVWSGEDIAGKILLVSREQGIGDSIQFCRYLTLVKQRWPTCTIIFNPDKGFEELAANIEGVDQVVSTASDITVSWDFWVPLLSLPDIMGTTMQTIPNQIPYLNPREELVAEWGQRVNKDKIRVGLVWNGGHREDQPYIWSLNDRRNCDWSLFEQMILSVTEQRDDIEFYSIQKGDPAESDLKTRLAQVTVPIVNLMDDVKTWSDTAALVSNMDLVIAVDTSTVHLAGALGRPVWMLNRLDTCWRWFLRRTDSPWYPTMRIFRQAKPHDWQPVMAEITQELIDFRP